MLNSIQNQLKYKYKKFKKMSILLQISIIKINYFMKNNYLLIKLTLSKKEPSKPKIKSLNLSLNPKSESL
jgi:hypothetical protein